MTIGVAYSEPILDFLNGAGLLADRLDRSRRVVGREPHVHVKAAASVGDA